MEVPCCCRDMTIVPRVAQFYRLSGGTFEKYLKFAISTTSHKQLYLCNLRLSRAISLIFSTGFFA